MKATWNGKVIAESDETQVVEGNHYFPPGGIAQQYFEPSSQTSVCPWKGTAHYYDVVVDGERNAAAAWFYPETSDAANNIRDYVAFWKGIDVSE